MTGGRFAKLLAAPVAIWIGLVVAHGPLLRLPYYWDEAGYFVPAALDFFRHGWLIPRTTLANGHPPLLSIYLAVAWSGFGFHPLVTRVAMLLLAAITLWGVYRLGEAWFDQRTGAVGALLLAVSPLFFAQSSLAQLDLAVAAGVIWGLVYRQRNYPLASALALTAACLVKETAVIVPLTLLGLDFARWRTSTPRARAVWAMIVPPAVLALWFVYYHANTGYWFGNPDYFKYNVGQAALSPARILLAFGHRVWQLCGYNGLWLLTILALVHWRGERLPREIPWVIAAYLALHAFVGGAVLDRYLLPASALFFLLAARELLRWPRAGWVVAGCAVFLMVNWFWNPPYPFPYEDNLAYATFVRLHQSAAEVLQSQPHDEPIATAWPATDELHNPDLGYVQRAMQVRELSDFSQAALDAAPLAPTLYLYSREYEPGFDFTRKLPGWRALSDRVFQHAPPVDAQAWERKFGLRPKAGLRSKGQWVALFW